jgi:alkyl hydroperoxide reductase subunit AhpC
LNRSYSVHEGYIEKQPNCAQPNDLAPIFSAELYNTIDKKIETTRLEDYRGKWVILFFYPSNFTFV